MLRSSSTHLTDRGLQLRYTAVWTDRVGLADWLGNVAEIVQRLGQNPVTKDNFTRVANANVSGLLDPVVHRIVCRELADADTGPG